MTGLRTPPPDPPDASRTKSPPAHLACTTARSSVAHPKEWEGSPFAPIYEINERCINLLVEAVRNENHPAPGLVVALKAELLGMTPEMRTKAAERALLLVDMGFRDAGWWKDALRAPQRASRTPIAQDAFPARAAMHLARSTLILGWHSIRADRTAGGLMLGISHPVADVIASLTLTDLDRIAEKRFRRLRPRWEERPTLWRELLLSVNSTDFRRSREFNLRALQLAAGELSVAPPHPK